MIRHNSKVFLFICSFVKDKTQKSLFFFNVKITQKSGRQKNKNPLDPYSDFDSHSQPYAVCPFQHFFFILP